MVAGEGVTLFPVVGSVWTVANPRFFSMTTNVLRAERMG